MKALDTETAELIGLQSHLVGTDPRDTRLGETPLASIALYCKLLNDTGWTSTLVPAQAIVTNQFIAYANDFDKKAFIAWAKAQK